MTNANVHDDAAMDRWANRSQMLCGGPRPERFALRLFPRPLGCGPIEAQLAYSVTREFFPRPLGCGPIEAVLGVFRRAGCLSASVRMRPH